MGVEMNLKRMLEEQKRGLGWVQRPCGPRAQPALLGSCLLPQLLP